MEDIFEDNVVELNPIQDPSRSQCTSKKVTKKHSKTSVV